MHPVVFRDISFVISPRRPLPGMLADGGVHDIGMSIQRSAGSLSSYLDGKLMSTRFYEEVAWFPRYAFGTVILGFNGPQGYIKSVIPSPLYQVRYIKSIISNPSYRFRYIKSVISSPSYRFRYIKSFISSPLYLKPQYSVRYIYGTVVLGLNGPQGGAAFVSGSVNSNQPEQY
jgi:hypothetical protein